jgi:hypothetical protein
MFTPPNGFLDREALVQRFAGWNSQKFRALPKQEQCDSIGCDLKNPYPPSKSFVLR